MRLGAALVLSFVLCACGDQQAATSDAPIAAANQRAGATSGKGFDFYVLALSWSPSYCESEGDDASPRQCASGRPYAFVVHGLWPQFERGYPADCATPDRAVAPEIVSRTLPVMPSRGLIDYQWRKHGSCAGLSQSDYFDVLAAARGRVVVPEEFERLASYRTVAPDEVERAFLAANPALTPAGVAVTCDRSYLREVRLCFTKSLEFRACPEVDRRACTLGTAVMPPVRGR